MKSDDFAIQAAKHNGNIDRKSSRFANADLAMGQSSLIRKTFSLPSEECVAIDILRGLAASQGKFPSHSEIVRAGLILLQTLSGLELSKALDQVAHLVPGRKAT
ncbi:hypothetical protein [Noviherbaspirillum pedocola]|uniref:Uncharacterized protein n=1 Tax=Noviherbaspirillum pedocola TaxID=2801341 RepID=A0A934W8H4_9BURK|nr:hypothetical protein [Noviherbaspirillum pedocola]MBK4736798.1 hypothetical protein [Noviherbaspirillum pedocola]